MLTIELNWKGDDTSIIASFALNLLFLWSAAMW